jgi:hypothetical protein
MSRRLKTEPQMDYSGEAKPKKMTLTAIPAIISNLDSLVQLMLFYSHLNYNDGSKVATRATTVSQHPKPAKIVEISLPKNQPILQFRTNCIDTRQNPAMGALTIKRPNRTVWAHTKSRQPLCVRLATTIRTMNGISTKHIVFPSTPAFMKTIPTTL